MPPLNPSETIVLSEHYRLDSGSSKESGSSKFLNQERTQEFPPTAFCEEESVTSCKCEVKGRVGEVSLGRKGRSIYGEGGRGMKS